MKRTLGVAAFLGLLGAVVLANWLVVNVGIVSVGFGLHAPAGVYAVALALVCRDLTQNTLGRRWSLLAIAAGALLSALISTQLALASGLAFALSESAEFAVYTALYRRNWLRAVIPAGMVGLAVDSAVFLWLAFGSEQFFLGQCVGKAWGILVAVILLAPVRRSYALRPT